MPGAPCLLLLATLASQPPAPAAPDTGLHLRAALELGAGTQEGADGALPAEGPFLSLLPLLALDGGEALGLELGAPLRFRRAGADGAAGGLRREDWDERSDWGQLLRELRLGSADGALGLRAGALALATLGHGHLVSRYANRLAADYHPAGASLAAHHGALRVEGLASDVLALRLFALEARVDLGRALRADEGAWERVHLSASVARDAGGGRSAGLSAGQLDLDAALYRGARTQLWAVAGAGARLDSVGGAGALVGLALQTQPRALSLGAKLQLRRQGGGFRHGLFGADLELARFSGQGLSETPLAQERLPTGFAGAAELALAVGEERADVGRLLLSLAAQHYAFGRTDADLSLALQLPGGRASATLRALATGMGQRPRLSVQAELRVRLRPALYAVAAGGSVHTPQADGHLEQGVLGSVGLGTDLAY